MQPSFCRLNVAVWYDKGSSNWTLMFWYSLRAHSWRTPALQGPSSVLSREEYLLWCPFLPFTGVGPGADEMTEVVSVS